MREIKFRAWASGEWPQRMVYAEKAHHFTITFCGCAIYDGDTGAGDFILMQFTGLLDCNGKEIYEGDVVSVKKNEEKNSDIVSDIGNIEIVWENGGLFLKGFSNNLGWQCENLDVEVIGNLYESPFLHNEQIK